MLAKVKNAARQDWYIFLKKKVFPKTSQTINKSWIYLVKRIFSMANLISQTDYQIPFPIYNALGYSPVQALQVLNPASRALRCQPLIILGVV